jgi:hypothetical protein
MKKLFTLVCMVACLTIATKVVAQGDDALTTGSNFYVFLLDGDSKFTIANRTVLDLGPNEETAFMYFWMADWLGATIPNGDGTYRKPFTCLANDDYEDYGYYGNDNYLNVEHDPDGVVGTLYSGMALSYKGIMIDLSALDEDAENYYFHVALKTTNHNSIGFTVTGYGQSNANYEIGDGSIGDRPQPDVALNKDGKWHLYEIPVKTLIDKGLALHRPIDAMADLFNLLTIYPYGPKYSTVGIDALFFYKKNGNSGINKPVNNELEVVVGKNTISVLNTVAPVEVYSITGQKVYTTTESIIGTEKLSKGVYVVKSGNAVSKVAIR